MLAACWPGWTEPALAWSPGARQRMVEDAARLVPPALQRLLKRYQRQLLRGMDTRVPEPEADHFAHPDGSGQLVESVADAVRAAYLALEAGEPLRRVVARLGRVAHLVADLNDPLASNHDDPREPLYAEDYARYVEKILPRVRLTLEDRAPRGLDPDSLRRWSREAIERTREFYAPIGRSYWVEGRPVASKTFDERSIPFGIGSLTYSRAVNDVALAWMTIWREAGGDASGALYDKLIDGHGARAARPADAPSSR